MEEPSSTQKLTLDEWLADSPTESRVEDLVEYAREILERYDNE